MAFTPFLFACGNDTFGTGGFPANSVFTTFYTTATSLGITNGRIDGFAIECDSFASNFTYTFPARTTAAILFAFRIDTPQLASVPFFLLNDGATTQIGIALNAAQQLFIFRNGTGNVLGTSSIAFSSSIYHQVEFQWTIDNINGAIELRLNGDPNPIIVAAGIDTQQSASNTVNVFLFQSGGALDIAFDDIILREADGLTVTSDWLGNVHIGPRRVNGVGANSGWTPVGAVNNFDCVNENPPNGNTDFVQSGTPGQRDSYLHEAAGTTGATIYAIQVSTVAELDVAGASTFSAFFFNGADFPGADVFAPPAGSYAGFSQLFMVNPSTLVPWTEAEFNAGQFGVIEVS
jgi:hypothetical protein